ncbi:histidinol-phosphate transaminase [bacterium]|nr:histidinol-phosphate transaminase [bacterium]
MDTPTPSKSAWTKLQDSCFKPEILNMPGYSPPPQTAVRIKLDQNEAPDAADTNDGYIRWNRYPAFRHSALIKKIATHYCIADDRIVLGNGSNSLLYLTASAMLERGDNVVLAPPVFSLYETIAHISQARIINIPRNHDFSYNSEAMIEAAHKAKLMFIASPDNPTGYEMDLRLLEELLQTCPGFILCDEAYGEFSRQSAIPLLERYSNLLVVKTFSKALALGGARLGWLMARPEAVKQLNKAAIPYAVDDRTAMQAEDIMDNWQDVHKRIDQIMNERVRMAAALEMPGITVYPGQTNFLLCRFNNANAMFKALKADSILVRDVQSYPGLNNCLRITIGTPEENDRLINLIRGESHETIDIFT